jgi:hypothetical protein
LSLPTDRSSTSLSSPLDEENKAVAFRPAFEAGGWSQWLAKANDRDVLRAVGVEREFVQVAGAPLDAEQDVVPSMSMPRAATTGSV